jgi:hypothetical protein
MTLCRACGFEAHGLDRCEVAARKRAAMVVHAQEKVVDAVVHAAPVVVHAEATPGGVSDAAKANKGTRHGRHRDTKERREYRAEWARKDRARKAQQRQGGV